MADDGTQTIEATFGCDDAITTWEVPAGGSVEHAIVYEPPPGEGTWTLTAEFDFGGNSAQTVITVVPDGG